MIPIEIGTRSVAHALRATAARDPCPHARTFLSLSKRIPTPILALVVMLAMAAPCAGAQSITPYKKKIVTNASHAVLADPRLRLDTTAHPVHTDEVLKKTRQLVLRGVPNVVGLFWVDAETALYKAGYKSKTTFEEEPDPSVAYGHVRETIPASGALVTGDVVEIKVPGAASKVGAAAISLSDVERRAGFDLDEGHYEDIYRGADIVLRKHEDERRIDENGNAFYIGGGLYIEASDGAVLAEPITEYAAGGSWPVYNSCKRGLERGHKAAVQITGYTSKELVTFCVATSNHQLAVISFFEYDNPCCKVTDYKFHYALFPRQKVQLVTRPAPDYSRLIQK